MENLPEKRENTSLSVHVYKPGTKAIEVRREMAKVPEVSKVLKGIERLIFAASIKPLIEEYSPEELVKKVRDILNLICYDIGLKKPDSTEWEYITTRIPAFLQRHYASLTLSEFKLAFELLASGDLNDFLPKDRNGEPDKNHYQQLSLDYIGKVLNAYKGKQGEVIHKAIKAIPPPEKITDERRARIQHNRVQYTCLMTFLKYKYFGSLELSGLVDMFVYDWLLSYRLADEVKEELKDRQEALDLFAFKVTVGVINKYAGASVRNEGLKSRDLDHMAHEIAKKREIKAAFDRMIEENVNVNQYINFK